MKFLLNHIIVILTVFLFANVGYSQKIVPNSASYAELILPNNDLPDTIFVYQRDSVGELADVFFCRISADSFQWDTAGISGIFNSLQYGYDSSVSVHYPGLYRVIAYDTAPMTVVDTAYFYVFYNSPEIRIDSIDTLALDSFELYATATLDTFRYWNYETGKIDFLPPDAISPVSYSWAVLPSGEILPTDLTVSPPRTKATLNFLPEDDFHVEVRVVDYNCVERDSAGLFEVMKAGFTATPASGPAPLVVEIENQSKLADSFTFILYNENSYIERQKEQGNVNFDEILTTFTSTDVDETFSYTYPTPDPNPTLNELAKSVAGDYNIVLIVKNSLGQVEKARQTITVEPSSLQIPNVFTPNGDGANDKFYPQGKSIKYLSIYVFNRWQQRVHFEEKDNLTEGDIESMGWDGTILGVPASEAVYYYYIEAEGYDQEKYRQKGELYLRR